MKSEKFAAAIAIFHFFIYISHLSFLISHFLLLSLQAQKITNFEE